MTGDRIGGRAEEGVGGAITNTKVGGNSKSHVEMDYFINFLKNGV